MRDGSSSSAQTLISNGCGASVGLEAGFAQIGSAIASRIGVALDLRRQDLRTLVGCGAAGAIAAAFAAPLTGAFYAFELIIGAYSLAQRRARARRRGGGDSDGQVLGGAPYVVERAPGGDRSASRIIVALVALGLVSAVLGVAAMRAAALVERGFQTQPAAALGAPRLRRMSCRGAATLTPQVLGAGHGALDLDLPLAIPAATLVGLILLKLTACLISLASGFRGGLFFASLFVGALVGKLFALGAAALFPALALDPTACLFAGHGDARRRDRRRPADDDVSRARKLGRPQRRRRRSRCEHRDEPRRARDLRLFVLDVAAALARRNDL